MECRRFVLGGFAPQGEFRFCRNFLVPPTRGRLAAASGLRALRGGCSPPLRTPLVSVAFMGEVTGFQRGSFRGQILCVWSFFEILRVCKPGSVFHCNRLVVVSVCSIATLLQSEFHGNQNRSFPMENALLILSFDSNETGKRADRTGNSPISKFQTQHAYDIQ